MRINKFSFMFYVRAIVIYIIVALTVYFIFQPYIRNDSSKPVSERKPEVVDTVILTPFVPLDTVAECNLSINDSAFISREIQRVSKEVFRYVTEVGYRDSNYHQHWELVNWLYAKKGLDSKQNNILKSLRELLKNLPNKSDRRRD